MNSQTPESDIDKRLQEAMKQTEEILAADTGRSMGDATLPIYRVAAEESLERERARYESGDKMALLGAIRICANHDLPLPGWASRAYISAFDAVLNGRVGTWDRAFGRPWGGQYMRRRRMLRDKSTNHMVCDLVSKGTDVGVAIATAATKHNVSPKTVELAYYKHRRSGR